MVGLALAAAIRGYLVKITEAQPREIDFQDGI